MTLREFFITQFSPASSFLLFGSNEQFLYGNQHASNYANHTMLESAKQPTQAQSN